MSYKEEGLLTSRIDETTLSPQGIDSVGGRQSIANMWEWRNWHTRWSQTPLFTSSSLVSHTLLWWNGRHTGFKIRCGKPRDSSSLLGSTNYMQVWRKCSTILEQKRRRGVIPVRPANLSVGADPTACTKGVIFKQFPYSLSKLKKLFDSSE